MAGVWKSGMSLFSDPRFFLRKSSMWGKTFGVRKKSIPYFEALAVPSDSVGVKDRRSVVACSLVFFKHAYKNMPALEKIKILDFSFIKEKKSFDELEFQLILNIRNFIITWIIKIWRNFFRVSILLFQL